MVTYIFLWPGHPHSGLPAGPVPGSWPVVLPGIGDLRTLEAVSRLAGQADVGTRSVSSSAWRSGRPSANTRYSTRRQYVNPFRTGPSARAEPIRRYHAAFPDLHLDVEELIVGRAVEKWAVGLFIQLGVLDDPWPSQI